MSDSSLNSLIDQAVEQLPWAKRRIAQTLLKRPRLRADACDMMAAKMVDEPCCASLVVSLNDEGFTGSSALEVTPENLKAVLAWIAENLLPILLRLLFPV